MLIGSKYRLFVCFLLYLALLAPACSSSSRGSGGTEPSGQEQDEASAEELYREAMAAEEAGDHEVAGNRYARAFELKPASYNIAERYSNFLIARRRSKDAVKVASTYLGNALGETKGYHLLADAQMEAQDWIGAYSTLSELIELDEGDGKAFEKRGRVQVMRNNTEDALADIKKAIELEPESADFRATLGAALERAGKLDQAALELRNAIQLDPRHGRAYVLLGVVLRKQGEYKEAVKVHEMAIKFMPGSARAYFELGLSQNYVGDNLGAEISLKKATELEPDDAVNWYAYGEVLRAMKRFKEAVAPYRKALDLDPDHAKAANKLGVVLYYAGLVEEAEAVLTDRVRKHPEDSYTYFNLGQVYAAQEKYGLAIEAFEKFVQVAPEGDGDIGEARKQIKLLKRKAPPPTKQR